MKKLEVIQTVENSVSSIYSREDVINIINMIDETKNITVTDIGAIIDKIIDQLQTSRLVDVESAEFEVNYNRQIELTDVNVDFDLVRETIENNLDELVNGEDLVTLERGE